MDYCVRAGSLAGYQELVNELGANPISLLKQAGFLPSHLRDADNMIVYEKVSHLLELTALQLADPLFGFKLGLRQGIRALGLIGAHMAQQENIATALSIARKYSFMHVQGAQLALTHLTAKQCELQISLVINELSRSTQVVQLSIALIYRILRDMAGADFELQCICLQQAISHEQQKILRKMFQCEVVPQAQNNALLFSSHILMKKPIRPDNLITDIIHQQFQLNSASVVLPISDLVKHSITMLLPTGECNKDSVALNLGMHPKKLERSLKEAGTSFREVLNETRKSITLRTLEMSNMSMTTLALNLGYAEFSVFSRSFKHWFGLSPRAFKRQIKK